MHERGSLDEARELDEAFRRWLDATGREVRVVGGGLMPTWARLKELRGLPRELSLEVRSIVARVIRTGDKLQAWRRLGALSRASAKADARMLRTFGGPLCSELAEALDPSPRGVQGKTNKWSGLRWVWIACALLSGLGRLALPSTHSAPPSPSYSLNAPRMHYASAMASALADDADRLGAAGASMRARNVLSALDREECTNAQYHADVLEDEGVPSELAARVRAMKGALKLACPADTKEGHSGP